MPTKLKTRTCETCGKVEQTFSAVKSCALCCATIKKNKRMDAEMKHLTELGYTVIEPVYDARWGSYRLIAPCCGREFTPSYGNVIKQLTITGKAPCRWCGGEARIAKAQAEFKRKYSRDPSSTDYTDWLDYEMMARRLTQINYVANKSIINPHGYERSQFGWHLDHKVPVSVCFDEGVSVEAAASLKNLEMLPAQDNLIKSKFTYDAALLTELLK